jgi:hypothetical protein
VHRLDVRQVADVVLFEPGEERTRRPVIGLARIAVADRRGEEFKKTADGMLAGTGDRRRDDERLAGRGLATGRLARDPRRLPQ